MEKGMTIEAFSPGQTYQTRILITDHMVRRFAQATGDHNPLHLDEDFARKSIFKRRVAHGMLTAGIISGVLGTQFPGLGTIYLSQTLKFLKPVFIDDQVTVQLKVLEVLTEKNRLRLETTCLNQKGETVLSGEALVMPPA